MEIRIRLDDGRVFQEVRREEGKYYIDGAEVHPNFYDPVRRRSLSFEEETDLTPSEALKRAIASLTEEDPSLARANGFRQVENRRRDLSERKSGGSAAYTPCGEEYVVAVLFCEI